MLYLPRYDMASYPFDTQRCFLVLLPRFTMGPLVKLVPVHARLFGSRDLIQYFIKDLSMTLGQGMNQQDKEAIVFEVGANIVRLKCLS